MADNLGMTVGLILRLSVGHTIQQLVTFNYGIFFNLLLPPIILASGYELHQNNFFRNIGTILTFAFAGTFVSAVVLGLILWVYTHVIPFEPITLTFVDAISVGATLSATDPVTILAIFNTYKVDPKLYTIIFGESILNDAIAIVLFETAQDIKKRSGDSKNLGPLSLLEGTGYFLFVFFGSLVIGVVVGILTALGLKYTFVRRYPKIESCLIVLIAYASYFFSNGLHMSGMQSYHVAYYGELTSSRHRVTPILRNHHEALRLLQHVSSHAAHYEVSLPSPRTTVGELHLYLPWTFAVYRHQAPISAAAHYHHGARNMRS